ncbi:hypothetical protein IMG5_024040 [Ichthyophthirius multifiliis]|uniref:Uncharacterized protein n=1 Tax=Ichthyophthirius multifiliis TaxID=5932 RepID=G0QL04_ICHMU|nr:hypothetical protein IMG5_024040 [Ichthyophthirius multifiliis]EGR34099.1 hypothetical protein IMG5_024040 [Ichthyophthirius multifiliis]|eukprot:XP_004039403.1 hypothetical protein IMG5_024040 [Ichthyophthirius multifiliis]
MGSIPSEPLDKEGTDILPPLSKTELIIPQIPQVIISPPQVLPEPPIVYDSEAKDNIILAFKLLSEIQNDSQKSLEEITKQWNSLKQNFETQKNLIKERLNEKEQLCNKNFEEYSLLQQKHTKSQEYINYLKERITQNLKDLDISHTQTCERNRQYVQGLKNDKLVLSFIRFLREAIQQKNDFNLIQKVQLTEKLNGFLQNYNQNNVDILLQFIDEQQYNISQDYSVQQRTDKEIGTKHIDNSKGDLDLNKFNNGERKVWSGHQKELLDLLDKLEDLIVKKMQQQLQDEIQSSILVAKMRDRLLRENTIIQKQIDNEISILKQMKNDFKVRVDDYIDDKEYQYEGYNEREIDKIRLLRD